MAARTCACTLATCAALEGGMSSPVDGDGAAQDGQPEVPYLDSGAALMECLPGLPLGWSLAQQLQRFSTSKMLLTE